MRPSAKPARPLVTALVAAHNESRHIEECLKSLLAQDYQPFEILVADDGSSDDTAEKATRLGVKVLRLSHRGKARTLNEAAKTAGGEILLFLDGDMVFDSDYVSTLTAPIHGEGKVGTAHGTEAVANPTNRWARCWQQLAGLPPGERLHVGAEEKRRGSLVFRAVRREAFLAAGGFDDIGYADDQTLAPKLGKNAEWVTEAKARHYNPETLSEVWGTGRWSGKTIVHRFGSGAWLRYSLPVALGRAGWLSLRHANLWLFPYVLTRDTATFVTIVQAALGGPSHGGK